MADLIHLQGEKLDSVKQIEKNARENRWMNDWFKTIVLRAICEDSLKKMIMLSLKKVPTKESILKAIY